MPERPIRIVDQWMYHSRLYRCGLIASRNDLDLIRSSRFGCGLDTDHRSGPGRCGLPGKIYTMLSLTGFQLGLRPNSYPLSMALNGQQGQAGRSLPACTGATTRASHGRWLSARSEVLLAVHRCTAGRICSTRRSRYTGEMQEAGYTILAPQMAPIHFELVEELRRARATLCCCLRG